MTTPRTDGELMAHGWCTPYHERDANPNLVPVAFARQLERELAEANENHAFLRQLHDNTTRTLHQSESELRAAKKELAAERSATAKLQGILQWAFEAHPNLDLDIEAAKTRVTIVCGEK